MSNEISFSLSLQVNNPSTGGGFADLQQSNAQYAQNAVGAQSAVVALGTTPTTVPTNLLTTLGWAFLQNLDATNDCFVGFSGPTLSAPVLSNLSTQGGGSLASGTYYYVVTAIVPGYGETAASNEKSVVVSANGEVTVPWAMVSGATGYRVYRGTSAGLENVMYPVGAGITSFTDTGAAGTSRSPGSNTTGFWGVVRLKAGEVAVTRLSPGLSLQGVGVGGVVNLKAVIYQD